MLPANIQDRDGAKVLLAKVRNWFPRLRLIWADGAYAGELVSWVMQKAGGFRTVLRPVGIKGFVLCPPLGGGANIGWLNRCRRLSKDYERHPHTTETWIHIAMIRLMSRRLLPKPAF